MTTPLYDPNFPIVITTLKREDPDEQVAYYRIPEEFRPIVYIFTRESRAALLKEKNPSMNVYTIPDDTDPGIARTRQVVLEEMRKLGHDRVWMLDDRIRFQRRHEDEKIYVARTVEDFQFIYDGINALSKEHIMVSLAHRKVGSMVQGNGKRKIGALEGGRAYTNYAIQLDKFEELGVRFDGMWQKNPEIKLFEDFYVVLSLLTRGIPNILWTDGSFEHAPGHPNGGNFLIRTLELQEKCARALQAEFPDFVKLTQKDPTTWWKGEMSEGRMDVMCYWQKALAYGKSLKTEPTTETGALDDFF
jgi:hypothetical protein